jgi:G3E family GTPase
MTAPAEFILLAGFLGSGKTSLLVDWLALPEAAHTAVIVNEAGEIDVDGAIIAESGTIPMAMLANGCVCCSLTNDLVFTIRALVEEREKAGLPPFRRIVLEASGLSRPGPILRSLAPLAPLGLAVRVVATCDASQAAQQATQFDEVAAQLAAAGTIVITKPDLAEAGAALALASAVNPLAVQVLEQDRRARARAAFAAAPPAGPTAAPPRGEAAHPRIAVLRASFGEGATWEDRLDWMEDLAAFCGDRLLRVKGFIRRPGTDATMLVQAVGTLFSPPLPMTGGRDLPEALVVIVRDLSARDLRGVNPAAPVLIASYRAGEPLFCAPAGREETLRPVGS